MTPEYRGPGWYAQAALRVQRWDEAVRAGRLLTIQDLIGAMHLDEELTSLHLQEHLDAVGANRIRHRGLTYYPRFQFTLNDAKEPRLAVARAWLELRSVLLAADWPSENAIAWTLAPNGWLDGTTPAQHIEATPHETSDALVRAVRKATQPNDDMHRGGA